MEFQTRSDDGEIINHSSMNDALYHAELVANSAPIWKISFTIPETKERIRLVRSENGWILEDVFGEKLNPTV